MHTEQHPLPKTGLARWSAIEPFMPLAKSTFINLGQQGKAPKGHRISVRCTVYNLEEIHKFIANPSAYRVGE